MSLRHLPFFLLALLITVCTRIQAQTPQLVVPAGHGDQVYLTKFSGDGKYLFSVGTGAKSIKVWETGSGRLLRDLPVDNFPTALQLSADNRVLAIGTQKEIYFYAFPSFKLLYRSSRGAKDAVIKGNYLYFLEAPGTSGCKAIGIDLSSFKERTIYEDGGNSAELISAAPQGDKLFISGSFAVRIVDINSGTVSGSSSPETGTIYIGYTPAGNLLSLVDKGKDKSAPAINDASGFGSIRSLDIRIPTSYRLQSLKNQVVYAANDQLCIPGDGNILIVNTNTGKKTGEIKTPGEDIIAMSAYGNMLVAGDKFKGTLKQYDISTGRLVRIYGEDAIAPIVWEAAAKSTGLVMDGMFDSPCGYFKALPDGKINSAAFQRGQGELMSTLAISADATIVATFDQEKVRLYRAPAFDKPYNDFSPGDKKVAALGISPDNGKLVVAYKNYVAVYDAQSGKLVKEIPNSTSDNKVAKNEYLDNERGQCIFSDNGKYAAINADAVTVFDLEKNTSLGSLFVGDVKTMRLSADGGKLYYLKGKSYNEGVKWCEYDILHPAPPVETTLNLSLDEVRISDDSHQKISAAISPDLNYIAYVQDDRINVYNRKGSGTSRVLKGHQSYVRQVRWLANGILVSSGNDNTVRFWDAGKGTELARLILFTNGSWVTVTPEGQFDASEDAMKKIYYVQGIETIPLDNLFETFYTPNLLARIMQHEVLPVPEVDVNTLAAPPKVRMTFDVVRNLVVGDNVAKIDWANETIVVNVKAECTENAIDEIRLYLNGKLVDNASRNLVVEDDNQKSMSKSFTVKLTQGINNFKAIALNKQRTESQPDEVDVNYSPAKNIPAPTASDITLHLVIIGINAYKNPKYNLNYATADATSFRDELQGSTGVFGKTRVHFITDADALKAGIESAMKAVVSEAKPQDLFIFYYAGHGVMADAADKKEFYIVPYDVTQLYGADDALAQKGISAKELQEFSKNIPAQKQLFILDACQSAGMIDAIAMRGAAEEKAIAQLARSTGSHWLTASGSEQFASEFSQLGHGVFTYCLLQGLKGAAANGDKQVTVNELKAYLELEVPELSQKYKGTPQYPASYGFGNDFPVEIVH